MYIQSEARQDIAFHVPPVRVSWATHLIFVLGRCGEERALRIYASPGLHVTLAVTETCPCRSGRLIRDCCGATGTLFRAAASTTPPPPATDFTHPDCYAGALRDCSTKISGEHYISADVLQALGDLGPVSGFTWLGPDGSAKVVAPGALVGNVLCKRHNEALSSIDARAGQFFRQLQAADEFLQRAAGTFEIYLANGHDLERWLLKMLCGVVAADVVDTVQVPRPWRPPIAWLRILFGGERFPPGWGLYVPAPIGHADQVVERVEAAVISNTTDGIYGLTCRLRDKQLVLAMIRPATPLPADSVLAHAIYRPGELLLQMDERRFSVMFCWEQGPARLAITWQYARPVTDRSSN
jgi:hypothetical protein